jgi:hypothetical protein
VLGSPAPLEAGPTAMCSDRQLVWSIEVLGRIVASEPLRNNPYLGHGRRYGDPVA